MGLDNGVIIKKSKKTKELGLDDFFPLDSEGTLEVIYWRKWNGPRNDVINYLYHKYKVDDYNYLLDEEDIMKIITILYEWSNEFRWNDEGGSTVWYYSDNIAEQITEDIKNLSYLFTKMAENPDAFEVYFYDSY